MAAGRSSRKAEKLGQRHRHMGRRFEVWNGTHRIQKSFTVHYLIVPGYRRRWNATRNTASVQWRQSCESQQHVTSAFLVFTCRSGLNGAMERDVSTRPLPHACHLAARSQLKSRHMNMETRRKYMQNDRQASTTSSAVTESMLQTGRDALTDRRLSDFETKQRQIQINKEIRNCR
jgi:hypothetical protein